MTAFSTLISVLIAGQFLLDKDINDRSFKDTKNAKFNACLAMKQN